MDNISSLRGITPEVASAPVHLFEVAPALRFLRGGRGWTSKESRDTAKNPPRGVVIEYHLAQAPAGEVMLTIAGAEGETIRQFSSGSQKDPKLPATAGTNRFVWNMRYPGAERPPSAGALTGFQSSDYSQPAAPVATPGRYVVRLSVDGRSYERPFEIRKDPRVGASDADLKAQFELMVDIRDRYSEVVDALINVRELRDQVEGQQAGDEADATLEQLKEIESVLTIWMGSEAHPMMWSAPGLTEKLSTLSGVVSAADGRPTESMYAVFEDLSSRFEAQRNRLNQVIEEEVGPLPSR
jgi:hypothetical protein